MPEARFVLDADGGATVTGRTGSDGQMRRDLSTSVDLKVGDAIELICLSQEGDLLSVLAHAE